MTDCGTILGRALITGGIASRTQPWRQQLLPSLIMVSRSRPSQAHMLYQSSCRQLRVSATAWERGVRKLRLCGELVHLANDVATRPKTSDTRLEEEPFIGARGVRM